MKKKLTTTLGLTTVAATGLFAQSVYAEETVTPTVTETPVATETSVETTTTPVAPVTEAEVQAAETAKNTAEEAVATAATHLADVQATIDTTTAELDKAQAVEEKVENIQPVIDQAESDKTLAEEAKASSQAELATATTAVTTAQDEVTTAQEAVTNAQADETAKANAVTTAQTAVTTVEKDLNGSGLVEAQAELDTAKADVEDKTETVTKAETTLVNAEQADANRQKAIATAQAKATATKTTFDTATADLNTATGANQTAQADLVAKKDAFTTAENDYKSIQKFVVIPEYVEALDKYANSRGEEKMKHMQTLADLNEKAYDANPRFIDNENDKKNLVKDGHLTDAQRLELSLYAADLVNQICDAFGKPRVTVTQDAIDFAKQVADGYEEAREDYDSDHNTQVINRVAAQYGLYHTESGEGNFYENAASYENRNELRNMNDMKALVHQSVELFMFIGYEWEHAQGIAGFGLDTKWFKEDIEYFGIDVSYYLNKQDALTKRAHFIQVRPKQILDGSTFDTTAIENPNSSAVITERYNQAKTAVDIATTAATTATANLTKAQAAYTSAKTAYDKAVADLTSAQAVKVQTPDAQRALNTAQANLAHAQATLTAKEDRVKELTAGREVLLEKLNKAKAELTSAQAEHSKAVTVLKDAQADLASKQAVLDTAVAKRDGIQARIAELETLRETATEAQEVYQSLLDMVAMQVDNDVFVLEDGTIVAVPKVVPKVDPLPEFNLNDLIKDEQGKQSGKQAGSPVVVMDGQAPVAKPTAPLATKAPAPTATTTVAKAATLPETGEESTSLVSLLGFVTLGLGLATASKRRRQG